LIAKNKEIPLKTYKKIVSLVPVMCVDIVLWQKDKCLMVKRTKEPLRDKWWIVGGRLDWGERLEDAAIRITKEEVNLDIDEAFFICNWEAVFEEGEHGPTHTVSAIHEAYIDEKVDIAKTIKLDSQASEWRLTRRGPPEELGV